MKRQWKMHQWKTLPVALGLLLCGGCNGEAGVEIEETRHPDGTRTTVIRGTAKIKWDVSENIAELVVQDRIDDWVEELTYISVGTPTINAYGATVPFSGSGPSYQLETEISLLKNRAEDNGFSYEVNRTYTDLMVHTAEQ